MGSQAIQSHLWGQRPQDWANIQEQTVNDGYIFALDFLKLTSADSLLDVGCGSGLFASITHAKGATVTGIDATAQLIEQAKLRAPDITFLVGEIEDLPFGDATFSVVSGFNSFQYAANVKNALTEAKRVLKPGGKLVALC
jgi:ubiquinone/menaquinone biosynthesis C-methylase UbiE